MSIWPPIIMLMLMAMSFSIHCAKAGRPQPVYDPIISLIGAAITSSILWWGGFFEPLVR